MFALCEGSHTVGRDEQSEIPDVKISSGNQDARIRRYAGDDRNPSTDGIEYRLQRRCIERGMFRLEDNVVVRFRNKHPRHFAARRARVQAMTQHCGEIGTPSTPIVVDVDCWDTRLLAPLLQFGDRLGKRYGTADQILVIRKAEIIDDVD